MRRTAASSVGSTTYQYDALGHLLEVKTPSETITYTYDGLLQNTKQESACTFRNCTLTPVFDFMLAA